MPKKNTNTILLILLLILAGIYAATKIFDLTGKKSNFNVDRFQIDTAAVNKIVINPNNNENAKDIQLVKTGNTWKAKKGDISTNANSRLVRSYLNVLANLNIESLISKNPDSWAEYNVTDTSATKVTLHEAGEKPFSLLIGRFEPKQQKRKNQLRRRRRRRPQGNTYIRVEGNNSVFTVKGMLSMLFKRGFSDLRDHTVTNLSESNVTGVSFKYPADSSYKMRLKDSVWVAGNQPADTNKVKSYFGSLNNLSHGLFKDQFTPEGEPDFKLILNRAKKDQIPVSCYKQNENTYIITSSQNEGTYFESSKSDLFRKLFKPKSYFVYNGQ